MKLIEPWPLRLTWRNYLALGVVVLAIVLMVSFGVWCSATSRQGFYPAASRFGPDWHCTGIPEGPEFCAREPKKAPPSGRGAARLSRP